jgi:hypothetical protein
MELTRTNTTADLHEITTSKQLVNSFGMNKASVGRGNKEFCDGYWQIFILSFQYQRIIIQTVRGQGSLSARKTPLLLCCYNGEIAPSTQIIN